ncbi:MAG: FixH family protein [Deltaproteobacteria bacterium]|nr:FixH family protein [Deltaproteobacteria bacterium]
MNNSSTLSKFQYYKWPLAIVLFFICLAIFHSFLLMTAFSKHPDAVDQAPYEKGIAYQQVIDKIENAYVWGLKTEISISSADPDNQREVSVNILETKTPKLSIDKVTIRSFRANDSSLDQEKELNSVVGDYGNYRQILNLPKGLWIFEITIVTPQGEALVKKQKFLS